MNSSVFDIFGYNSYYPQIDYKNILPLYLSRRIALRTYIITSKAKKGTCIKFSTQCHTFAQKYQTVLPTLKSYNDFRHFLFDTRKNQAIGVNY